MDKPRILVVDDEEMILSLLCRILTSEGYQVACASNGQIALAKVGRNAYDAVICDLSMPVMGGLAFYRELLRTSPGLASKVIFCPSVVIQETCGFLLEMGNVVLPKPFQMKEVHRVVKEVLDSCEQNPPACTPIEGCDAGPQPSLHPNQSATAHQ